MAHHATEYKIAMSGTTPTGMSSKTTTGDTARDGTADTGKNTRGNNMSDNMLAARLQDADGERRSADCESDAMGKNTVEEKLIDGDGVGHGMNEFSV